MRIRELQAAESHLLASFRCRMFREPWTDVAEEIVRGPVRAMVGSDELEVLGLFDELDEDDPLIAVAAWSFDRTTRVANCAVLAVRYGQQRRGFGSTLKAEVVERARAAGALVLTSKVHWDNESMTRVNQKLGATQKAIPRDRDYCRFILPL